jgi:sugar phosphate isomerase/epimerase
MLLGYNTNGLAHHRLVDAIEVLASLGYQSVAITLDHGALSPRDTPCGQQLREVRSLLEQYHLRSVVETGARFLLDPWHKHEPTLLSPRHVDRARRIGFLRHAIDVGAALQSDCVSIWSGVLPEDTKPQAGLGRLVEGLQQVLEYADKQRVTVALEPEPGMLIDTMESLGQLLNRFDSSRLALTLDLGHLHCLGETPIAEVVRRWGDRLRNVHIEDMRTGVHEHLMFGEGEIDFPPALGALSEVGYQGGLHVELSRHSHEGPAAAKQAMAFLQPLVEALDPDPDPDPEP